ncbi:hypothetical protein [Salicibibacter kimchii]|uniref:hypothetical protein n=1 Tax=Salicibibacter kimchii TaxID=2099786 RepID=UPI001356EE07|nr:hypothetical protein [Salicibibacter kimchii]
MNRRHIISERKLYELEDGADMMADHGTVPVNVRDLEELISVYRRIKYGERPSSD